MTNIEISETLIRYTDVLFKFWSDFEIYKNVVGTWMFQPFWTKDTLDYIRMTPDCLKIVGDKDGIITLNASDNQCQRHFCK